MSQKVYVMTGNQEVVLLTADEFFASLKLIELATQRKFSAPTVRTPLARELKKLRTDAKFAVVVKTL